MKKVKVSIKDRKTLVLEEDANQGDIIDLSEITKVDLSYIEKLLKDTDDETYNKKLEDDRKQIKEKYDFQIETLNKQIKELEKQNEERVKSAIEKEQLLAKNQINDLKNEIANLKSQKDNEIELNKEKIINEYNSKINELNNKIEMLEKQKDLTIEVNVAKVKEELQKQISDLNQQLNDEKNRYLDLQRQKSTLNVKQIGEDLEIWCNNEVTNYMQNGFLNCVWYKDNKVIQEENEFKGSKADFIFKIYASEEHKEEELLTSLCLEMKNENPQSVNKKSNADYFKALDKNRNKKECKYAILVSELEADKTNNLPIYKVNEQEYKDMYVVQPAYLMVFLNMIVSLTTKFAHLYKQRAIENEKLKSQDEFKKEFDSLKDTYLDKPLNSMKSQIETISKQNKAINDASKKIEEAIETITKNYINEIENKLERFDVKINKSYSKLD